MFNHGVSDFLSLRRSLIFFAFSNNVSGLSNSNKDKQSGKTAIKHNKTFSHETPLFCISLHAVNAINAPTVRFADHRNRLSFNISVTSIFESIDASIVDQFMKFLYSRFEISTIHRHQNSDTFFDRSNHCDHTIEDHRTR